MDFLHTTAGFAIRINEGVDQFCRRILKDGDRINSAKRYNLVSIAEMDAYFVARPKRLAFSYDRGIGTRHTRRLKGEQFSGGQFDTPAIKTFAK